MLKSCSGRGGSGGGPSSWFQWVGSPGYESRAGWLSDRPPHVQSITDYKLSFSVNSRRVLVL